MKVSTIFETATRVNEIMCKLAEHQTMACPSQTQFFKATVSHKKGSEVTNRCGFSSGWNCFPKKITHEFGKVEL